MTESADTKVWVSRLVFYMPVRRLFDEDAPVDRDLADRTVARAKEYRTVMRDRSKSAKDWLPLLKSMSACNVDLADALLPSFPFSELHKAGILLGLEVDSVPAWNLNRSLHVALKLLGGTAREHMRRLVQRIYKVTTENGVFTHGYATEYHVPFESVTEGFDHVAQPSTGYVYNGGNDWDLSADEAFVYIHHEE